jgi:polyisoprenoid-binding protein YceI
MKTIYRLVMVAAGFLIIQQMFSQKTFNIDPEKSKMTVKGTSNLHDWEMRVEKLQCKAVFNFENNIFHKIKSINDITFSCKAKNILSDNSIMDSKTQVALKADKYPDIIFSSALVTDFTENNSSFGNIVSGKLTVAGVTNNVKVTYKGKMVDPETTVITGSTTIDMTSFKAEPPSFLFGAFVTGKLVTIEFEIVLTSH